MNPFSTENLFSSLLGITPSCDLYASTSGKDANPGTLLEPLESLTALVAELPAGQTGCLMSGQTFVEPAGSNPPGGDGISFDRSHGTPTAPVTITSSSWLEPATIAGRVITEPGADWMTFTHLDFTDPNEILGPSNFPSISIGSAHTSWTYDDVQNANTTICINLQDAADPLYGPAQYTLIDHDRIHNCGTVPLTSASQLRWHTHGVYDSGIATTITNNYIYANASKGVLLRGDRDASVMYNVIDTNGSGVVFGDDAGVMGGSSNDLVADNIITNSATACPEADAYCNSFGVWSWWNIHGHPPGHVGTGNVLEDNCLYNNEAQTLANGAQTNAAVPWAIDGRVGYDARDNLTANPMYVDAGARDYTLRPGSPCLGYGPDSAQP